MQSSVGGAHILQVPGAAVPRVEGPLVAELGMREDVPIHLQRHFHFQVIIYHLQEHLWDEPVYAGP